MPVQSNFNQVVIAQVSGLRKLEADPATRLGAVISLGIIDARVWNDAGTRTTAGEKLSNYSNRYMPKRIFFNRGESRIKILSLTGDMNNQFNIVPLEGNDWGLGWAGIGIYDRFGNANIDKARAMESLAGGHIEPVPIFRLSQQEIRIVMRQLNKHIKKMLNASNR
jgi:hypothetical protein